MELTPSLTAMVRSAAGMTSTAAVAEPGVVLWSLAADAEVASDSSAAGASVVSVYVKVADAPPARVGIDQVRTLPAAVVEPADALTVVVPRVNAAGRPTGTTTSVWVPDRAFETVSW